MNDLLWPGSEVDIFPEYLRELRRLIHWHRLLFRSERWTPEVVISWPLSTKRDAHQVYKLISGGDVEMESDGSCFDPLNVGDHTKMTAAGNIKVGLWVTQVDCSRFGTIYSCSLLRIATVTPNHQANRQLFGLQPIYTDRVRPYIDE